VIAREHLGAQISGISAQFPFVYTGRRAERKAASGDLLPAPAAGAPAALHPSAGLGAAVTWLRLGTRSHQVSILD
jgi:hypothetical protein